MILAAFYLMIATGTFTAMKSSDKYFEPILLILNSLFWPVFWAALITCDLMDK